MSQITTISFFRYNTIANRFWAFKMMQLAQPALKQIKGQTYYKLMGSGRGLGFNPWPDWSVYSLLQVWESQEHAVQFMQAAPIMQDFCGRSSEQWTLYMKAIQARGEWSGSKPFQVYPDIDDKNPYLAVITRATIKTNQILNFWRDVPRVAKALEKSPGLLFAKGVGDIPLLQMATFSLWENEEAMYNFAYRGQAHMQAMGKVKKLALFTEDMFCRFQPYQSVGTWRGVKPLLSL